MDMRRKRQTHTLAVDARVLDVGHNADVGDRSAAGVAGRTNDEVATGEDGAVCRGLTLFGQRSSRHEARQAGERGGEEESAAREHHFRRRRGNIIFVEVIRCHWIVSLKSKRKLQDEELTAKKNRRLLYRPMQSPFTHVSGQHRFL